VTSGENRFQVSGFGSELVPIVEGQPETRKLIDTDAQILRAKSEAANLRN
jgi:hypothetical protein